jgi:erythromycin esterase
MRFALIGKSAFASRIRTQEVSLIDRRKLLLGGAAVATTIAAPLAAQAAIRRQSWRQPVSKEVVAWLKANAMPLATIDPSASTQDLEFLRSAVEHVRVLSLGEATHATHEFVQLKSRIIQYCVAELGFTMIAVENDFGRTLQINDFVLAGKGSAAQAVAAMSMFAWTSEEFAALVDWVRAWNVTHVRQVKFYGIDMQGSQLEARYLLDYLKRVAPDLAAASEGPLVSMRPVAWAPLAESAQEGMLAQITSILAAFDGESARWIARTSVTEWNLARHSAVVIEQCVRCPEPNAYAKYATWRDRCMAGNVRALMDIEGPQTKAFVCAHNGHVQRTPLTAGTLSMGHFLREQFGAEQVVIGFSFNQGRCSIGKIISFRPAPAGFFDAALARTGLPLFALDLRRVALSGPVADWMASEPYHRSAGGGLYYEPRWYEPRYWIAKVHPGFANGGDPRENFDFIVFVETSTPTRPL